METNSLSVLFDMFGGLLALIYPFILFVIILFVILKIFTFPIQVAERKELRANEISIIKILTWCGIISGGLTWLIALCCAFCFKTDYD